MTAYDLLAFLPLSCAAWQDHRQRIIPDWTCALIALCALLKLLAGDLSWWKLLGGGVITGALLLTFSMITDAAGGGDVKLCAALGLLLGFPEFLSILIPALILLILWGKWQRHHSLPFAPFLWLSFIAVKLPQIIFYF